MKILWIEDFGANTDDYALALEIFGDIIPKDKLDEDEEVAPQLVRLIGEHSLHELHLCRSYSEWLFTYKEHSGDFDIAIIDINLETYRTALKNVPKIAQNNKNFDKLAGFHIYHQLIKNGMPDDNIAFFTAEAGNFPAFREWCGKYLLDTPKYTFEKSKSDFGKLRKWLSMVFNDEYLILRRGIIDGCEFILEELSNTPNQELDKRLLFYKTTTVDVEQDPQIYRWELMEYLEYLKDFFPIKEQSNRYHKYSLFVKDLAKDWERSAWSFRRDKSLPLPNSDFLRQEDLFYETSQALMKLLRNWTVHDLMKMELAPRDIAYLFMLAMRSKLQLDFTVINKYEKALGGLFDGTSPSLDQDDFYFTLEQNLYASYREIKRDMQKGVQFMSSIRNQYFKMVDAYGKSFESFEDNGAFLETIRNKIQESSMILLYRSYWHGLFPLYLEPTSFGSNTEKFDTAEKLMPGTFPYFLGKLIFAESFRQDVKAKVA